MISIKYVKTSNTFIIHIALEWKFNDECIAITKTIRGVIQWLKWYRNLENTERERERGEEVSWEKRQIKKRECGGEYDQIIPLSILKWCSNNTFQ